MALEPRRLLSAGDVLTYHNDSAQDGLNPYETVLTPSNVNQETFGKQFEVPLDGPVIAQPLFEAGVNITVGNTPGRHDVVFVATQHDSVYAIDSHSGEVLWHDSFIDPAHGVTTIPPADVGLPAGVGDVGIISTPVIDPNSGTLYVLVRTKEIVTGVVHYVQKLHALDVSSGAEKDGGPTHVADTSIENGAYVYNSGPFVLGSGAGAVGGIIYYNSLRQNQRPALTLADGRVFVASASQDDIGPYHGWVLSYDAATLQLDGVFCDTPNGSDGGIWQSGAGAAVDAQGFLYYVTGNGTFDTRLNRQRFPGKGDFGDSVIKLAIDPTTGPLHQSKNGWGLKLVDYFTPSNQTRLSALDLDLGSGGPALLPDNTSGRGLVHLLLTAGKDGRIYLLNRDSMGKFNPRRDRVAQEMPAALGQAYDTPAYFNNTYYYAAVGDYARAFTVSGGKSSRAAVWNSPNRFAYAGATPSVSSNGANSGIVWMLDTGTSELRAYNALNIGQELYDSSQALNGRDRLGPLMRFSVPTVAHGQVFVGTANSLAVFGLILPSAPRLVPPSNLRIVTVTDSSVTLAWQNNSSDADGLRVYRRMGGGPFNLIATLPPNATEYVNTSLEAQTQYTYFLTPFNAAGATSSEDLDVTTLAQLRPRRRK
jgi:hypothetical protein